MASDKRQPPNSNAMSTVSREKATETFHVSVRIIVRYHIQIPQVIVNLVDKMVIFGDSFYTTSCSDKQNICCLSVENVKRECKCQLI